MTFALDFAFQSLASLIFEAAVFVTALALISLFVIQLSNFFQSTTEK
jgi:hypothetical protein